MKIHNIILIGMPGAGKSTVGVVLAKMMGYRFVDSDLVIQDRTGKLLWELLDEHGLDGFRDLENEINASLELSQTVLATGGSAVYGERAMEHLHETGTIIYLQLTCSEIRDRLGDLHMRGVAMRPGQTLEDLYRERVPLYEKYADITISCGRKSLRDVAKEIYLAIQKRRMRGALSNS